MSFFTDIKNSATAINANAKTYFQHAVRNDSESFNYESFPIVNILPNFSENVTKSKGGNLVAQSRYSIQFLDGDSWENFDNDNFGTIAQETTYEIIERMKLFANAVVYNFLQTTKTALTETQSVSWLLTPVYRITSNSLSGVLLQLNYANYINKQSC